MEEKEGSAGAASSTSSVNLQLPLARVKRIIKSDPDVKLISSDAAFLIAKSTELFLEHLVKEAYQETQKHKRKALLYSDISSVVKERDELEFLNLVIPDKK
uniref:Chromatin accessibility complex protein 1 n=1 Tax=Arcella intermedia TaxID=1963864 RepID=A0A6B2LU07_9EUKA